MLRGSETSCEADASETGSSLCSLRCGISLQPSEHPRVMSAWERDAPEVMYCSRIPAPFLVYIGYFHLPAEPVNRCGVPCGISFFPTIFPTNLTFHLASRDHVYDETHSQSQSHIEVVWNVRAGQAQPEKLFAMRLVQRELRLIKPTYLCPKNGIATISSEQL